MATFKILTWHDPPEKRRTVNLQCMHCGKDADLEVADIPALIIASMGMGVIFDPPSYDPPDNFFPDEIQCRSCRRIFSGEPAVPTSEKETEHVR